MAADKEIPDHISPGITDDIMDDGDMGMPRHLGKLPEGIKKEMITEGKGLKTPKAGDDVTVHYVGTLQSDGSEFDSSRSRNKPFEFCLGQGQVIKGWDLGVATMNLGEVAKFTLAPEFAYGEAGSPPNIPAGATLVFEVELLSWTSKDDLFQDGGVIKSRLTDGSGWKKPKEDDEVRIDLRVTAKDGSVVDEKNGFEYAIGSDVLKPISKVVDKALVDMSKGEEVALECSKEYAYGEKTPDGATVTITLREIYETVDVSLDKNKSIMKKQVIEGQGWDKPKDCAKVKLKVDAATDGSKALPGFVAKTIEFIAGNGEVCEAIECAVAEMKLQEKALVTCSNHLLAAEEQLGLSGASSDKVVLTLELLEFEKAKDTWNMDESEKVAFAASRKDAGSTYFRAGRARMALERYKKVISLFSHMDNMEASHPHGNSFEEEDNKTKAKELKKACELNSAACQLKLKDFTEAKKLCDSVLKEEPKNAKAMFRRAQSHLGLKDFGQCIADVKKHIEMEPQSREARELLKEARAGQKEEDNKSKGLFGNMCKALGKGPIPPPSKDQSFVNPERSPEEAAQPASVQANSEEAEKPASAEASHPKTGKTSTRMNT